ncbi:unnamed protein product [Brassica rapa subsp. trilocularis]
MGVDMVLVEDKSTLNHTLYERPSPKYAPQRRVRF